MLVRLCKKQKVVEAIESKDGKKHVFVNFYLETENGTKINIRSVFDRDFCVLKVLADEK